MLREQSRSESDPFKQRNREIGSILAAARQRAKYTVTECAAIAATTRRRYSAIERGEAVVSAAELEVLMQYLKVPAFVMWKELGAASATKEIVVQVQPGERVQLVVEVQE